MSGSDDDMKLLAQLGGMVARKRAMADGQQLMSKMMEDGSAQEWGQGYGSWGYGKGQGKGYGGGWGKGGGKGNGKGWASRSV